MYEYRIQDIYDRKGSRGNRSGNSNDSNRSRRGSQGTSMYYYEGEREPIYDMGRMIDELIRRPDAKNILREWGDCLEENLSRMKTKNKDMYENVVGDLYTSMYGEHFDEHSAMKAVESMENVDGTRGEHWDIDQSINLARQNNVPFADFNEFDWFYVLNMMYSDYYKVFGNDTSAYVKLAKAWLEDPDVSEGKAYRYYSQVVK